MNDDKKKEIDEKVTEISYSSLKIFGFFEYATK